jgi:hypothetical protein
MIGQVFLGTTGSFRGHGQTSRGLKNSLDYRFYDFVIFFENRSLKLQQFTLKIGAMAYYQSAI